MINLVLGFLIIKFKVSIILLVAFLLLSKDTPIIRFRQNLVACFNVDKEGILLPLQVHDNALAFFYFYFLFF